uniref:Uncharacterized protein n=1 Tax=Anguilla anguilla TaxID=7936 RepID=A0A0E9PXW9_ANGAN
MDTHRNLENYLTIFYLRRLTNVNYLTQVYTLTASSSSQRSLAWKVGSTAFL